MIFSGKRKKIPHLGDGEIRPRKVKTSRGRLYSGSTVKKNSGTQAVSFSGPPEDLSVLQSPRVTEAPQGHGGLWKAGVRGVAAVFSHPLPLYIEGKKTPLLTNVSKPAMKEQR